MLKNNTKNPRAPSQITSCLWTAAWIRKRITPAKSDSHESEERLRRAQDERGLVNPDNGFTSQQENRVSAAAGSKQKHQNTGFTGRGRYVFMFSVFNALIIKYILQTTKYLLRSGSNTQKKWIKLCWNFENHAFESRLMNSISFSVHVCSLDWKQMSLQTFNCQYLLHNCWYYLCQIYFRRCRSFFLKMET